MPHRLFNFSAGPAVLPEAVLEEARENLLSLGDSGVGIMEHSHRGKAFTEVYEETVSACRELANIPENYKILFLQGGASSQFYFAPMNFLPDERTADYHVTGTWSQKAIKEAKILGNAHTASSSEDKNFNYIPKSYDYSDNPVYVHMTSNNTIFGTQYQSLPEIPENSFLISDNSSDIFSKPIDVTKYGLIYAGAQKNLGPSGVTLVIIRDDLIQKGSKKLPSMLQYRTHADKGSMFNTPPTFGIYIMGLVLKWIHSEGGLSAMDKKNKQKAGILYNYLEQSKLFNATAEKEDASLMNVTFVTGNEELDKKFIQCTEANGFSGIKGHRSVGGMRASIYNAFPEAGIEALVKLMKQFESDHQ